MEIAGHVDTINRLDFFKPYNREMKRKISELLQKPLKSNRTPAVNSTWIPFPGLLPTICLPVQCRNGLNWKTTAPRSFFAGQEIHAANVFVEPDFSWPLAQ